MNALRGFSLLGPLLICAAGSGCSFALVTGPPEDAARRRSFDCTDTNNGPVLDLIFAGLTIPIGILGVVEMTKGPEPGGPPDAGGGGSDKTAGAIVAGVGFGAAAIFGVSAIVGFSRVSRCREARAATIAE